MKRNLGTLKIILSFLVFLVSFSPVFSQSQGNGSVNSTIEMNYSEPDADSLIALNTFDYLLSPGDKCQVDFFVGLTQAVHTARVNLDYSITFPLIGTFDVSGWKFIELKKILTQKIMDIYPKAIPRVTLLSLGNYRVNINGELSSAGYIEVNGLIRLNDVITALSPTTQNDSGNNNAITSTSASKVLRASCISLSRSSTRNICITSISGIKNVYDLYKYKRFGDFSQNPYIRSGDVITINKVDRFVRLQGEITNPNTFELLPSENYSKLIEYAGNYTSFADKDRITITRNVTRSSSNGDLIKVDLAKNPDFELVDLDTITVYKRADLMPVIYIEGAISNASNALNTDGNMALNTSTKLTIPLYQGQTLSMLMRDRKTSLLPVSDLKTTYVIRGDKRLYFNLEKLLFSTDLSEDIALEPNDKIIIPYRQFFVTVAGAVASSGRFPYVPDRDWHYYINLAGGINTDLNTGNVMTITDRDGKKKTKNELLQPEDRIYVESNSALYYLGKVTGVLSTLFSSVYYISQTVSNIKGLF